MSTSKKFSRVDLQVASPEEEGDFKLFSEVGMNSENQWFCLYTRPRHEKSVARVCRELEVNHYLPLTRKVHHYKSGRKERWLPLFPGYLFCKADSRKYHELASQKNVLSIIDVVNPNCLHSQLSEIYRALQVSRELETIPYLQEGDKVRITEGPFKGIVGVITEKGTGFRVWLNVNLLNRSVPLEADARTLDAVN
jgi:transcription antitermination factor NusG